MIKLIFILFLFFPCLSFEQTKYQKDFDEFWTVIDQNYAYFEKQGIDWQKVKSIYARDAANITNNDEFIRFLETVINEFHNGHVSLNTNLESSNNLIPSGTDLFVEKINDKFILTDIRKGFGSDTSGLKIGMEIVKFNDLPIPQQLHQFLPKYTDNYDREMIQYALSMLFAGTHNKPRRITTLENNTERNYYPAGVASTWSEKILEYKFLVKSKGYIKINNSLGNNELINEFDKALDSLMLTKSLIIDLTETPGGGNSTVARAIMGRFIHIKMAYQQHEVDENPYETKRYWIEYVLPRKKIYEGQIIVMVGHWTGSMGEGIAIGFDRMKKTTVIGTRMGGLIGAIEKFQLTETKIGFQIPTERLYHINGTPREDYIPQKLTADIYDTWRLVKKTLRIKN